MGALCGRACFVLFKARCVCFAARLAGVELHEHSRVLRVETRNGVSALTADGVVHARFGVLACDAHPGGLEPRIAGRIMAVANYLIAMTPLEHPEQIVADHLAVSDRRFVVNYFRMSEDGRLIFGGGECYTPEPPGNITAFARTHLRKVLPQLGDVKIDYAWGGLVSVTMSRLPHIGRLGDLFFAHGYSGQGTLLPALAGKVLVAAMAGTAERFDVLSALAPPAFPGGASVALIAPHVGHALVRVTRPALARPPGVRVR